MGQAKTFALRMQIVNDCNSGLTYTEVSEKYSVHYNTVREYYKKYQSKGEKGLIPDYSNCGKQLPSSEDLIYRATCWLKRLHPDWGAPFIRIKLEEHYQGHDLPSIRTMQRWFQYKGLNKVASRLPKPIADWAKKPHDTWQVDAKEQVVLADGGKGCWLTIVDEKSGALLATLVFPPQQDFSSTTN